MTEIPTFSQTCYMNFEKAEKVLQMLETHEEFSEIGVEVKFDLENVDPVISKQVPEGEVLIVFDIPRNISMSMFYGEFHRILNQ